MTVVALRRRQPETLSDLLEAYGREVHAVAYLILRDRDDAEDVVIETLLTAFEKGGSIRDERALRSWLIRVATNQALGKRRRSGRVVRLAVVPDRAAAGDLGSESANRVVLLDAIAALPLQQRSAIVLRYYASFSVDEIALALGKSPNTIKAQLQVALNHLRRQLTEPAAASLAEARHA